MWTLFNVRRRRRKSNIKSNSADFVHSGGDSDHQEVILYVVFKEYLSDYKLEENIFYTSDQICVM